MDESTEHTFSYQFILSVSEKCTLWVFKVFHSGISF